MPTLRSLCFSSGKWKNQEEREKTQKPLARGCYLSICRWCLGSHAKMKIRSYGYHARPSPRRPPRRSFPVCMEAARPALAEHSMAKMECRDNSIGRRGGQRRGAPTSACPEGQNHQVKSGYFQHWNVSPRETQVRRGGKETLHRPHAMGQVYAEYQRYILRPAVVSARRQ